jgi:hypothetical protein
MTEAIQTKKCTKCGETKAAAEFYKAEYGEYGVMARCKKCHGISSSMWVASNRIKSRAIKRRWGAKNADAVARMGRAWRSKNREKVRDYYRAYYKRNPNREYLKQLKYRKSHPALVRAGARRWAQARVARLADSYLRQLIKQDGLLVTIEQLREQIQFNRTRNFFQFFGIGQLNITTLNA